VQRKAQRRNPLPKVEEQAQYCECAQCDEHAGRLRNVEGIDNNKVIAE
jgi:hypothetical protein